MDWQSYRRRTTCGDKTTTFAGHSRYLCAFDFGIIGGIARSEPRQSHRSRWRNDHGSAGSRNHFAWRSRHAVIPASNSCARDRQPCMKLNSPPAGSQGREAKHLKPKVGAGAPWMGGWFYENHFPTFVGMEILITSIALSSRNFAAPCRCASSPLMT